MKNSFLTRIGRAVQAYRGMDMQAAAALAPAELPVAKPGQTSIPGYKKEAARNSDLIRKVSRSTINTDATTFRTGTDKAELTRNFLSVNPDMSATVNAYLRVGIPRDYTIIGYNMDGTVSPEATKLAQEILTRITYVGDATLGYNPSTDLQSMSEALGRELLLDGAMAVELVLDDLQQPLYPSMIAVSKLQWREDGARGVYPVQVIGGEEIDLDLPTVFYVTQDQDLLTPYAEPYFNTATRAILNDEGFSNYLQRQLRRNISPRMVATIIEEKVRKSANIMITSDPVKFGEYVDGLISQIESTLEDLEPEDALVATDMVTYDMKAPGGSGAGVGDLLTKVAAILESRTTAALKSMPAVLGRDTSSGSATASSMLFLKNAAILSTKLNTLYSRLFTMAVRLMAMDCYVEFKYAELSLRPDSEEEAYKQMRQDRVLTQLSLGFITDEQAGIMLTGKLPPQGFKPLSGTRFKDSSSVSVNNTPSQTSNMNGQPDNLKSNAPTGKKGN